jgi:hypothetical protein
MTTNVSDLQHMTVPELRALYKSCQPGPIPNGSAAGSPIVPTGTVLTPLLSGVLRLVVWQGKTFDARRAVLKNRVLLGLLSVIIADIYIGPSWVDDQACIVLDYSRRSVLANRIRDEIRQISPRVYFGPVYAFNQEAGLWFSLEF